MCLNIILKFYVENNKFNHFGICTYILLRKNNLFLCLKVLLSSATHGMNYEELVLDNGNAILPDTSLTTNGEHLYVLTRSNVSCY